MKSRKVVCDGELNFVFLHCCALLFLGQIPSLQDVSPPWVRNVKCLPDSVLNPGCAVHPGVGREGAWLGGTKAGS